MFLGFKITGVCSLPTYDIGGVLVKRKYGWLEQKKGRIKEFLKRGVLSHCVFSYPSRQLTS